MTISIRLVPFLRATSAITGILLSLSQVAQADNERLGTCFEGLTRPYRSKPDLVTTDGTNPRLISDVIAAMKNGNMQSVMMTTDAGQPFAVTAAPNPMRGGSEIEFQLVFPIRSEEEGKKLFGEMGDVIVQGDGSTDRFDFETSRSETSDFGFGDTEYGSRSRLYKSFQGHFPKLSSFSPEAKSLAVATQIAQGRADQQFLVIRTNGRYTQDLLSRFGRNHQLGIVPSSPLNEPTIKVAGLPLDTVWKDQFAKLRDHGVGVLRIPAIPRDLDVRFERSTYELNGGLKMAIYVKNAVEAAQVSAQIHDSLLSGANGSVYRSALEAGYYVQPVTRLTHIYFGDKAYERWAVKILTVTSKFVDPPLLVKVDFSGSYENSSIMAQYLIKGLDESGMLVSLGKVDKPASVAGKTLLANLTGWMRFGAIEKYQLTQQEAALAASLGLFLSHATGRYFSFVKREGVPYLERQFKKLRESSSFEPMDQIVVAALYQLTHTPDLKKVVNLPEFYDAVRATYEATMAMKDSRPNQVGNDSYDFIQALAGSSLLDQVGEAVESPYFMGTVLFKTGTAFVSPAKLLEYSPMTDGKFVGDGYVQDVPAGYKRAPFLRYTSDPLYRPLSSLVGELKGRGCIYRSYISDKTYDIRGTIYSPYAHTWDAGVVILGEDGKYYAIKGPLSGSRPDLFLEERSDIQ